MACNCIKEVETKLLEKFKENYKGDTCNNVSANFENQVLSLDTGNWALVNPFKVEYTFTKKNGDESRTQYWKVNMGMLYCPFCGQKIEKEEEDKKDGN